MRTTPDPEFLAAMAAARDELSGRETLAAMAEGRLPHPRGYHRIGLRLAAVRTGDVELAWTPTPEVRNVMGGVDGGYTAMVFDQACCTAAVSAGRRCDPMVTLSLSVDYLLPPSVGATYAVRAELLHAGRRRMVTVAEVRDPEGAVLARATASVVPDESFHAAG
ncbi:uncharacterized domain 1-containing protein [Amycolatopsis arida]|uniref:Uncharacterized domain 1-containing protein n=1 Tax=Amycolatopsis arida TaxID=587909 RepID=A0A1I5ZPB8_9PSEU|nr:PaaI family thioesterase [Amycolatopsis arida]TDX89253.1 uncharacterized protein (TIGR00369 family) [Amycolatopsis arida]SFQ58301.1 uncharacterized domain 1-containing protein [Amycolatopsis arida]